MILAESTNLNGACLVIGALRIGATCDTYRVQVFVLIFLISKYIRN